MSPARQERQPPFAEGQIVEDCHAVRYRVTRAYVPPEPGYMDMGAFELVRITPPDPFEQAITVADRYTAVEQ